MNTPTNNSTLVKTIKALVGTIESLHSRSLDPGIISDNIWFDSVKDVIQQLDLPPDQTLIGVARAICPDESTWKQVADTSLSDIPETDVIKRCIKQLKNIDYAFRSVELVRSLEQDDSHFIHALANLSVNLDISEGDHNTYVYNIPLQYDDSQKRNIFNIFIKLDIILKSFGEEIKNRILARILRISLELNTTKQVKEITNNSPQIPGLGWLWNCWKRRFNGKKQ